MTRSLSIWALLGLIALLLTACLGGSAEPEPEPEPTELALLSLTTGLDQPLGVAHAGDGSGRLFVVQKGGLIRVWSAADGLQAAPYADLRHELLSGQPDETGLLGLAFHPGFAENGRLFVHYTNQDGDGVLAELLADPPSAASVVPGSLDPLLVVPQQNANHQGGQLAFGPDNYLYMALGDGSVAGWAQDMGRLHGAILRLDIEGEAPYQAPDDNPFVGVEGNRDEIWVYGLRNPWRFSFDPTGAALWIADVGQNSVEEVNRLPIAQGGQNLGWPIMEGDRCYTPPSGCDASGMVAPVITYTHAADLGRSVTGGYVYRGEALPDLQGQYIFGDFASGRVFAATGAGTAWTMRTLLDDTGMSIASFGLDEEGELLVVDYQGGLYRLEEVAAAE